jgi:hypothetical protein
VRLLNWLYDKWVTFAYTNWLRPRARQGARLLRNGTRSRGRIVGIRVRYTGDSDSATLRYEYAVDVTPSAGERFRIGVRQRLQHGDRVRLGQEVLVRHNDRHSKAIIDWPEMLRQWGLDGAEVHEMGWRTLRHPPDEGIDDTTLRKLKGERTDAEIVRAARLEGLFGLSENFEIVLRAGTRQVLAKREYVPIYARHLVDPGVTVPVAIDGDRVRVDWSAAAEARPGSAEPPAPAAAKPEEAVETVATSPSIPVEQAVAEAPVDDSVEGVSFDTWVDVEAGLAHDRVPPDDYDEYAQRHGVPAGRWAGAAAAWHGRVMSDWTVGARYGEAYEAAMKRRRKRR